MPRANLRATRLHARPLIATVSIISLIAAYSLFIQRNGPLRPQQDESPSPFWRRSTPPPECADIHFAQDKCSFAAKYCQDEDAGLLPYIEWYYCSSSQAKPFVFMSLVVWLGLLFTTIGIAASDFFSVNLSTIATILGLSESLTGVTFLAFGNGSPDVFSTFAAMSSNSPGMAVGELIGAAGFISGVVAGSMALVREFRVDKKTYARDICFFIVSVAFAMTFLADGRLRLWECWAMVGFYAIYVITVVGWHWYSTSRRRRLRREGEARSHFYNMVAGSSGDELAGEPYRDEAEDIQQHRDLSSRSSSVKDASPLARGPRIEIDTQNLEDGNGDSANEADDEEHDRMVAVEMSRSMRVLRPGKKKSHMLSPIRPSLVGALEFRSALAHLQRESNLQLARMPGRSYSDHYVSARLRRGTTSEVPDGGHWDGALGLGVTIRGRASSYGGGMPPTEASDALSDLTADEAAAEPERLPSKSNLTVSAEPPATGFKSLSSPFVVGGNLAPPPVNGAAGMLDEGKAGGENEQGYDPRLGAVRSSTPSSQLSSQSQGQSQSQSNASTPSLPFPRFTDSPALLTPDSNTDRADFMLPAPGLSRRENTFASMQTSGLEARRPLRWWPHSLLPPPHIVLGILFPTFRGWRDKAIWDKFLSALSVPSIFLLVITLPVVEPEIPEDGEDDVSIMSDSAGQSINQVAPLIAIEPPENDLDGERGGVEGLSSRASVSSIPSPYPRVVFRVEDEDDANRSGVDHGVSGQSVAKPLSDLRSGSIDNDEPATWNRWLVCLQLFTGPLFATLIVWANMAEEFINPAKTLILMTLYTLVASLILLAFLFVFTSDHKRPKYHFLLCFLGFIISIAWISTIAGEVVGVLKTFGIVLNISEALLGLTIFAAGNSVGDLVANITVARLGYPVMALSACFGGPMLNILLGIGVGGVLMMVQHANKKHKKHPDRPLEYKPYSVEVGPTLMISAVSLLFTLVLLLIVVPLNKWILSRRIGWGLIAIWTMSTVANVVVEATGAWRK